MRVRNFGVLRANGLKERRDESEADVIIGKVAC